MVQYHVTGFGLALEVQKTSGVRNFCNAVTHLLPPHPLYGGVCAIDRASKMLFKMEGNSTNTVCSHDECHRFCSHLFDY